MTGRIIWIAGSVTAALAFLLGGWVTHRASITSRGEGPSDVVLTNPLPVLPLRSAANDQFARLSPDRWAAIERKFYPNLTIPEVSHLLHHLLNWGANSRFATDTGAISGRTMVEILTDGRTDPHYVPESPLLYRAHDGRPRLARYREPGSEGHPHQVLATFAALGLPGSRRVQSGGDSAAISELLEVVRSDFHLRGEIEWTAVTLACYAPTRRPWTNRWGRTFDFDMIADQLLARPPGEGTCSGTHVLYTLTVLLRVDAIHPIVSDAIRGRIRRHLTDAVGLLEAHQRTSGCWTPDWPQPLAEPGYEAYDDAIFGEVKLVEATGHHLEWLDILPAELAIDPGARRRALDWSVAALERVPAIDDQRLCPYSHCFRMVRRYLAPEGDLSGERGQ
jgi:hypothetical protein